MRLQKLLWILIWTQQYCVRCQVQPEWGRFLTCSALGRSCHVDKSVACYTFHLRECLFKLCSAGFKVSLPSPLSWWHRSESLLTAAEMRGLTSLGEENMSTVVNALGERKDSHTRAAWRRKSAPDVHHTEFPYMHSAPSCSTQWLLPRSPWNYDITNSTLPQDYNLI